jgi:hypothetical protein
MFNLANYGSEPAEKQELSRRLGTAWTSIQQVGKFYDQAGSDTWYYFVYGPEQTRAKSSRLPKNEIASNCIAQPIDRLFQQGPVYGDVAIIRSGPSRENDFPETFSKLAVVKDIKFNLENGPVATFNEREGSKVMRSFDGLARP